MPQVRVGLLGCGVVGSAVVRRLSELRGAEVPVVSAVAVRDTTKTRDCVLPVDAFRADAYRVVEDPAVDVVVEAIGGLVPAAGLIARALDLGKPVITANKAVLGAFGPELLEHARSRSTPLLFEAAVAGAIPVIRALSGLSRADEIIKIEAVLNGTSTFVLSHAESTGATLQEAVSEAQRLGYAEADPTRDLDGSDAADKLAVLVQYLFDEPLRTQDVHRLGIDKLTDSDVQRDDGRRWRLVATAIKGRCARVEPALLRPEDPLAATTGADNMVVVTTRLSGPITLGGAGAGGNATASSVVADLLAAQDWLQSGAAGRRCEALA